MGKLKDPKRDSQNKQNNAAIGRGKHETAGQLTRFFDLADPMLLNWRL